MALRPIDNALPLSPEHGRPKKQAKISISQAQTKQLEISGSMESDENPGQGPPAVNPDSAFEYILSEDLEPILDPDAHVQGLVEGLESKDWTKICSSLNDVRRFAQYQSDLMTPLLDKVTTALVKAMKNPRSTLCKTSIMASSDVFKAYGDNLVLEPNISAGFDQLLLQLLLKASQDKRFVCEEAEKALNTLVQSSPPFPLLRKIQAYINHNNLRIRAKAAMYISKCVSNMNTEELREFGFTTLLQMGANMLNDRLPEAREAARSTVVALYDKFPKKDDQVGDDETETDTEQQSWEKLCQSSLPSLHFQAIMKITQSLCKTP